ncbi:Uncharacterised protein g10130 [Pycnogonum litorale]
MFLIFVDTMKSSDEACVDEGCVCKEENVSNNGAIKQKRTVVCKRENIVLIGLVFSLYSDKINSNYGKVEIRNEVDKRVPARFLGKVNVRSVLLRLPLVETIDDDALLGQEDNIEVLRIINTNLSKIPIGAVKNLHRLSDFLILEAFNIKHIEKNCFHPLSSSTIESMQRFTLSDSNLRSIGKEAFTALKKLKILILQNTKLKSFPGGVLPKQEIDLYIDRNNFKDMQINVLNDLARQSVINYRDNMISSTSSKHWKLIIQKELVVYLHGNHIFNIFVKI